MAATAARPARPTRRPGVGNVGFKYRLSTSPSGSVLLRIIKRGNCKTKTPIIPYPSGCPRHTQVKRMGTPCALRKDCFQICQHVANSETGHSWDSRHSSSTPTRWRRCNEPQTATATPRLRSRLSKLAQALAPRVRVRPWLYISPSLQPFTFPPSSTVTLKGETPEGILYTQSDTLRPS